MKTTQEEIAEFKPGVYRHWKGGMYRALFLAQDSTNRRDTISPIRESSSQEPVVVYVSLSGDSTYQWSIYARELWQWNEKVIGQGLGPMRQRFQWEGP